MLQLKMLMKIALPKMGELLVMMMMMISPSRREVPPAELLRRRAKVLLPRFHLETVGLHPESPPPIFFLVKMTYIPEDGHRRWSRLSTISGLDDTRAEISGHQDTRSQDTGIVLTTVAPRLRETRMPCIPA